MMGCRFDSHRPDPPRVGERRHGRRPARSFPRPHPRQPGLLVRMQTEFEPGRAAVDPLPRPHARRRERRAPSRVQTREHRVERHLRQVSDVRIPADGCPVSVFSRRRHRAVDRRRRRRARAESFECTAEGSGGSAAARVVDIAPDDAAEARARVAMIGMTAIQRRGPVAPRVAEHRDHRGARSRILGRRMVSFHPQSRRRREVNERDRPSRRGRVVEIPVGEDADGLDVGVSQPHEVLQHAAAARPLVSPPPAVRVGH
mmetsp:Transcript_11056/g.47805  ORF Transcript_11056/g.47805 Transcript_11056/m.47805 type:complete len:258 (+) Transcript_11056:1961-2734(+)